MNTQQVKETVLTYQCSFERPDWWAGPLRVSTGTQ